MDDADAEVGRCGQPSGVRELQTVNRGAGHPGQLGAETGRRRQRIRDVASLRGRNPQSHRQRGAQRPSAAVGEAGECDADRTGRQDAERVEARASSRQRSGVHLRRRCRGRGRRSSWLRPSPHAAPSADYRRTATSKRRGRVIVTGRAIGSTTLWRRRRSSRNRVAETRNRKLPGTATMRAVMIIGFLGPAQRAKGRFAARPSNKAATCTLHNPYRIGGVCWRCHLQRSRGVRRRRQPRSGAGGPRARATPVTIVVVSSAGPRRPIESRRPSGRQPFSRKTGAVSTVDERGACPCKRFVMTTMLGRGDGFRAVASVWPAVPRGIRGSWSTWCRCATARGARR